jgi:hypothetical protein
MRVLSLRGHLRLWLIPAMAAILFSSGSIHALTGPQSEILPPARSAAHVQITDGPTLESVKDNWAIIKWISNNPGGTDEHFGVVHYGTDPEHLTETAKSHIRLNQNHPTTTFRVRLDGLKPRTTYYYTVDSMQSTGKTDGVKSPIQHFATP